MLKKSPNRVPSSSMETTITNSLMAWYVHTLMKLLIRMTPRTINFISAAKSMRRPVIGPLIKMSGAIPLERAQDVAKPG